MIVAAVLSLTLQAAGLTDQPNYAFRSASSASEAADCIVSHLRGRRLGANIFTLNPKISRVFDGYLVQIGPDIRITVEPDPEGSAVRLYTDRFLESLSREISACERALPEVGGARIGS